MDLKTQGTQTNVLNEIILNEEKDADPEDLRCSGLQSYGEPGLAFTIPESLNMFLEHYLDYIV